MLKKIKVLIYAFLGVMMCLSAVRRENYWLAAGIAFFVLCAIAVTIASFGQLVITWDEIGVTVQRNPKPSKFLAWSEMRRLKVDHLGYHIIGTHSSFRIRRENMPKELLSKVRQSIRENTA